MSKKILEKTLKEVEKAFIKSKVFRKYSDLKAHSVTIDWIDIRRELKRELGFIKKSGEASFQEFIDIKQVGGQELKNLNDIISEEAKKIARAARQGAEKDRQAFLSDSKNKRRKYPSYVSIEGTPLTFVLTLFVSKNDIKPISIWGGKKEIAGSVFSTARQYYTTAAKEAEITIAQALKLKKNRKGPQLNLAHVEENSIAQQRIDQSQNFLAEKLSQTMAKDANITPQILEELGIQFVLDKTSNLERDIISVGIGSKKINIKEGRVIQAADINEWRNTLKKAITKINQSEALAERPGSDSRITVEKKKVLKAVQKKLNKSKHLKVTFENTKVRQTKKTSVNNKLKPTIKQGTQQLVSGVGVNKLKRQKTSAQSNIGLVALLNARLPEEVRKNMGEPRLVNRTGKFASSVRAVDVLTTAKGFPSIGYTYDKNPYQVFEQGAGKAPWASEQRDPRKLIETSIREIASELLQGRFFTRRI